MPRKKQAGGPGKKRGRQKGSTTKDRPLVVAANELRAEVVEEALREACGSFARMGEAMGFSRQRAYGLAKRHDLWDLAKQLREEAGLPEHGPRPKK